MTSTEQVSRPSHRPWLGVAVGGVVVLLLVFLPIFLGQIVFLRDPGHWTWPARWFVKQSLLHGEWPTWNPLQSLGLATFSNPLYAFFYPPNVLYFLGSTIRWVTWLSLAHVVWGALGVGLLARRFSVGPVGCFVGGVSWALSGWTVSAWTAGVLLIAASWIPWCALGWIRLAVEVRTVGRRWLAGVLHATWPMVAAGLVGEIFVAAMAMGFGALVMVVWCRDHRGADERGDGIPILAWRRWLSAVAATLALVAMSLAVVVLPAWRAAGQNNRTAVLSREVAEKFSLDPVRLVEFVAPGILGDPYDTFPGGRLIGEPELEQAPLMFSVYMGASVFALALLGVRRDRKATLWLVALALAVLFLALGKHAPVHSWFRTLLRPFGYMRSPEKYLVLFVPVLALLAALGADRFLTTPRSGWGRLVGLAVLLGAAMLAAPVFLSGEFSWLLLRGAMTGLAVVVILLVLRSLGGGLPRWSAVLLPAVVCVDLALAAMPMLPFVPAKMAEREPAAVSLIRQAHRGRPYPPRVSVMPNAHAAALHWTGQRSMADRQRIQMETLSPGPASTWGLDSVPGYDAAEPQGFIDLWANTASAGMARMVLLGVEYVIAGVNPKHPEVGAREALGDPFPGVRVLPLRSALPRVYVAGSAVVVNNPLVEGGLLRSEVLSGGRVLLQTMPGSRPVGGAVAQVGTCRLIAYHNSRVEAECECASAGVAVFLEQWSPGWTAAVDGRPTPLLRANHVARAVLIEPGHHHIELRYAVPGLALGATLSLIGLGIFLGSVLFLARPRGPAVERSTVAYQ